MTETELKRITHERDDYLFVLQYIDRHVDRGETVFPCGVIHNLIKEMLSAAEKTLIQPKE